MEFDLSKPMTTERLEEFAQKVQQLQREIGMKQSARGWCYAMEGLRLINKNQFDKVENWINECRKRGMLPIDFVAEEQGRQFSGVEEPTSQNPVKFMGIYVRAAMEAEEHFTPDWWDGEEYYVQVLVEKIDLKTLFEPICQRYHAPIATASGWSSMMQRALYARRFKDAQNRGLQPVLLYAGDHDPDGLRISEFIKKNLDDLKNIVWEDGEEGFDPKDLIIRRFGLNYDFIIQHKLTWIDNLITGSGGEFARPGKVPGTFVAGLTKNGKPHKNFKMPYLQEYLHKYGCRKCEANAIVIIPHIAQKLMETQFQVLLGDDAEERFDKKSAAVKKILDEFRDRTGLNKSLKAALKLINEDEGSE